ncbi:MAG: thiamine phosphate synthase [Phycisphaerales bacterium]
MDRGLSRLTDANANRAREALRTMEDAARFRLGDGGLSGRIKALRHGLREALGEDEASRIAHRDTEGDVGTTVKTEGEGVRGGLRGVVIAAGKRAGEALRVLEECAKAGGGDWRAFERLRYGLYGAEKDLVLAMGTGRAPQWRLCVLVTGSACRRPWREVVAESVRGGADCVQVREPELADRTLLDRVREVRDVISNVVARESAGGSCGGGRVWLIVNNRTDVALAGGADGVHLGTDDLPISEARKLCGDRLLIGASTHGLAEARRSVEAGADYCGVGSMFPSTTKSRSVSGPGYLREYLGDQRLSAVPHLAIGGITPENIGGLSAAGCRGIAVSAVVCGAEQPRQVCERLIRGLSGE